MGSREKILAALKKNQPATVVLPALNFVGNTSIDLKEQFTKILTAIGGTVIEVNDLKEVADQIKSTFTEKSQLINRVTDLDFEISNLKTDPHNFSTVTVAIMRGEFGVAENGAIWLTDANMGDQVLPYICEHLILIINKNSIVATLHEAYEKIGSSTYNLGTFLAGPSKTADIEQSLVLGAHGSKSLIVFLLN